MIDSKVFKFLNDIKFNNNREWFNTNKLLYKRSLEQIQNFAIDLVEFMIGAIKKVNSYKTNHMNLYNVEDISIINFQLKNKILEILDMM